MGSPTDRGPGRGVFALVYTSLVSLFFAVGTTAAAPISGLDTASEALSPTTVGSETATASLLTSAPDGGAPGSTIENRAELSWTDGSGDTQTLTSAPAIVTLAQTVGVDIRPSRTVEVGPGQQVLLSHRITNTGTGLDCLDVTSSSADGFAVGVHEDAGGGSIGPEITACIPLATGASFDLLVVVDVPTTVAAGDGPFFVETEVASTVDPAITDRVTDQLTLPAPALDLTLNKTAQPTTVTLGDTITYSIAYSAGQGTAVDVVIYDSIPDGTAFVPGSLRANDNPLTDQDDGDSGRFDPATRAVSFDLTIAAGEAGAVSFQVVVQTSEGGAIRNVASASFEGPTGPVSEPSNETETTIVGPTPFIEKALDSASPAHIGEQVDFTIRFGNTSGVATARGTALVDTLPVGLEYVSAAPPATVDGRELRWNLGDLLPGASQEITLTARVTQDVQDSVVAVNHAWLESLNGPVVHDTAQVLLVPLQGDELAIDKRADVLEVSVGETVGYEITLENTGGIPLSGLVVSDTLPVEERYVDDSTIGADSVQVAGRVLTFFFQGPLAPGAEHTLRYSVAIVSGGDGALRNVAVATAEGGFVRSTTVTSFVQVREAWPMETRVAVGRVWIDLDGNGSLDSGEPGVEGAEVWTEDGQVATTDADGKFSFRNLRPGGHAFQLDVASLPASTRLAERTGDVISLTADGWTSPRVNFRLLPRAARVASIRPVTEPAGEPAATVDVDERREQGPSAGTDELPETPTLPDARGRSSDDPVEVVLEPSASGWPEVTYALPDGWSIVTGSTRLGGHAVADPELRRDRSGKSVLYWRFEEERPQPITVRLTTGAPSAGVEQPTVPTARTAEEREKDRSAALFAGPGVEIFDPADGAILSLDRVFIGVRGEASRPVALFDGDSLIAEVETRIDGVHDFIAVPLAPGPHRLRVRTLNSWGNERWDSVSVHVAAPPASFDRGGPPVRLVADGNTIVEARVRVLDRWGVPVISRPLVTVWAEGAAPANQDEDPKTAGTQVRPDDAGWLMIQLRPGRIAQQGQIGLRAGPVEGRIPLEVFPELRSLIVTGFGRIGVGASADAFGAITARGKLDDRTSITLSYDSRKLDDGRNFFGRGFDPLGESRYPIFGDASNRRTLGSSSGAFSGRIERGMDWLAFGELTALDFSQDLRLNRYSRSLNGAAARLATGPVTWRAFGSLTSQSLQQLQIRGAGTSGPYELAENIRPGTDVIVVETRDALNAELVLAEQPLARFIDYQIDYERGVVLLKRPVPAADGFGNPVFLRVTFEADAGGDQELVAGVRATIDVLGNPSEPLARPVAPAISETGPTRPELPSARNDALRIGVTGVRGGGEARRHYLAGADVTARTGAVALGAELSYASVPDSADVALAVDGVIGLFDGRADLALSWTHVGSRYVNPSNLSLRAGTEDVRVGGGWRITPASEIRVGFQRQEFKTEDVARNQFFARLNQSVGSAVRLSANLASDQFRNAGGRDESLGGELRMDWQATSRLSLFAEGRRQFQYTGRNVRPDHIGAGAEFRLLDGVTLEARHRRVLLRGDSTSYSVTSFGAKSNLGFGTQMWTSYQLAGGSDAAHNAAVIGLNNRVHLGSAWTIHSMFERRVGVDRAPAENPIRSLPFLQVEEDYWTAALGLELMPEAAPYRLAARGEYRNGDFRNTRVFTLAGDLSISRSLAVLSRQEYLETEELSSSRPGLSRRRGSLWGVAFRPIDSDALNVLTKFEYVDQLNPRGAGVLAEEGKERRLIGVAELIWAPAQRLELGARYATRFTDSRLPAAGGAMRDVESRADYVGARGRLELVPWMSLGADARLLNEHMTSAVRWDAAPSLFLHPFGLFEVEAGYRFGDLEDPDFSVRGGHGWFVTFGARLTRSTIGSAAEFWRERF